MKSEKTIHCSVENVASPRGRLAFSALDAVKRAASFLRICFAKRRYPTSQLSVEGLDSTLTAVSLRPEKTNQSLGESKTLAELRLED